MDAVERWHRVLRKIALGIAIFNLVSIFALDVREWLVYFDPLPLRVAVFPAFVIGLPLLPFLQPIDRNRPPRRWTTIWLALTFAAVLLFEALWIVQILIATFCRDPFWNFHWPWEEGGVNVVPLNRFDLSELYWIRLVGQEERPSTFAMREAPGIVLVATHLVLVPLVAMLILRWAAPQLPAWRPWCYAIVFQLLTLVLLKIALQCLFNMKYIVAWPEQMLNL
jgi:hypothetical protein